MPEAGGAINFKGHSWLEYFMTRPAHGSQLGLRGCAALVVYVPRSSSAHGILGQWYDLPAKVLSIPFRSMTSRLVADLTTPFAFNE